MAKDAEVFIIDDDPVFAKILEKRLQKGGFTDLHYFDDGKEGLEALEKGSKPKFIFLDFSLQTLNGLDTLKGIKKIRKSAHVIIATQLKDDELAQQCIKAGADLFLHKSALTEGFPHDLLDILWPEKGYLLHHGKAKG